MAALRMIPDFQEQPQPVALLLSGSARLELKQHRK